MKNCNRCKQDLPLDSFNVKGTGYQPFCKKCQKAYHREWYSKNKAARIRQIKVRKTRLTAEHQERIRVIKSVPCVDCGGMFGYWQMDFDHLRDKNFNIATAAGAGLSWSAIEAEIAKCEVVCANCHRTRTFNRMKEP